MYAGGGFRTRDLQIMSIAFFGEKLALWARLSYPGMGRLRRVPN